MDLIDTRRCLFSSNEIWTVGLIGMRRSGLGLSSWFYADELLYVSFSASLHLTSASNTTSWLAQRSNDKSHDKHSCSK